jgi:tRNA A-37 threonylcarbamoyl transferase component Bud32
MAANRRDDENGEDMDPRVPLGDLGADDVLVRIRAALADRYDVERKLAAGGMATVYPAHDRRHARRVAIKVLHPELSAVLGAERFLAEIRTTAALQHPHILPLFDSGSADGLLFYVMPFVEEGTLRGRLTRERQLPVDDALRIARDVADALDYAHRRGIVHRDVKPENILLHESRPLVADFGIALAVQNADGQRLTLPGLSLGTPAYMSPEQAAGDTAVDGRSDQYALACVVFECLAGEPPFTGATPQALLAKRFAGPVPDVGVLRDGVGLSIRTALMRAMSRAPADRFATTAAFAAALSASRDPPTSQPGVLATTPLKTRKKRRSAVAVGVGIAALAASAIVVWRDAASRGVATPPATASAQVDRTPVASRQLTFTGIAEEPSFSADGRQVVYVEMQCNGASGADCSVLRLHDVGSAQSAVLARAEVILHPFWTADGAWVVVLMKPVGEEFGTYIVPRLGGPWRRLGPPALVAFSASGDTILLSAFQKSRRTRFVRRVRAATGETLDSTSLPPALTMLQGLLPSRDGRWIVFRLENQLLIATPDGLVTDSVAFLNAGSLRWDPLGDALYAVVPSVGNNIQLVRVRVDSRLGRFASPVETLLNLGKAAGATFDVAPDGRTLVYTGGSLTTELWALEGGAVLQSRLLASSTGWLGDPRLSSDGQLVAYEMTDQTGDNVYVRPFAGGDAQAVTHDASEWEALGWVFGSHRLLYASGRPTSLYAQDIPDGARRVLDPGGIWFADGSMVELDGPDRRLTFRTATGSVRNVAISDSLGAILDLWGADADGSGAYVHTLGPAAGVKIVRVDRESGAPSTTIEQPAQQRPYLLAAERGIVVYATWPIGDPAGRPTIWQVRTGRPSTKVMVLPFACAEESLVMSVDRRRFACARRIARPDLFIIDRFDRYRN